MRLPRMLAFSFKDTNPDKAIITARTAERVRSAITVLLGIAAAGSIVSGVVSAVYWFETAHYRQLASATFATNTTANLEMEKASHDAAEKAASSQLSFEIVILVVILLACVALGLRWAAISFHHTTHALPLNCPQVRVHRATAVVPPRRPAELGKNIR